MVSMKLYYADLTLPAKVTFDAIRALRQDIDSQLSTAKRHVYTLEKRLVVIGKVRDHNVWWIPGWGLELTPKPTSNNGSLFWLVSTLEDLVEADELVFVPRSAREIIEEVTKA